jgi:nicotinamide mononucleotide transporter
VNPYEVAGVAFGVVAVWLTVRENVWCWPTGIVNVVLSAVVFAQARLYADMGLQGVYVALCLYGWYAWLHGGADHGALAVSRTPGSATAALTLVGIAFAAALGSFLRSHTDAALPFWDASTASFSLVAQWMQTRKWIENWLVWIAVDGVYVGMYVVKGLFLMAGLYGVFLALAVAGFVAWRRSLIAARVRTPAAAAAPLR